MGPVVVHPLRDNLDRHYHSMTPIVTPPPLARTPPTAPAADKQPSQRKHKFESLVNLQDAVSLSRASSTLTIRPKPPKRAVPSPTKTIAVINASGRQAASVIRVATAVGYRVRAQLRNLQGVVAEEIAGNDNVEIIVGDLYLRHEDASGRRADLTKDGPIEGVCVNYDLIETLFRGAELAFINTTFYGDEVAIGKAIADEAKDAGISHFIYSSMPNHHTYNASWPSLPLYSTKHEIEEYVKRIGLPATFVYTGIYNNNFTSLPFPLFCMELQQDGSFLWQAPFHPDAKLPWLDAEHDVGPAILSIFKEGMPKWGGHRIALAYEFLTPREACRKFTKGVGRKVRYKRGEITLKVPIPKGYRVQLEALEKLFLLGGDDPRKQPPYFGDQRLEDSCPDEALSLWEGNRGLEEYAREMFALEEQANGLTWMLDENNARSKEEPPIETIVVDQKQVVEEEGEDDGEEEGDEPLAMKISCRQDEEWLA